jgi:hypothetical protein
MHLSYQTQPARQHNAREFSEQSRATEFKMKDEKIEITLCLVDWYFSPGLPRPTKSHGCITEHDEDGDNEEVRQVEI